MNTVQLGKITELAEQYALGEVFSDIDDFDYEEIIAVLLHDDLKEHEDILVCELFENSPADEIIDVLGNYVEMFMRFAKNVEEVLSEV